MGPAGSGIALIDWLKGTSGAARGRAGLRGAGGRRVFVGRRTCKTFESKSVGGSGSAVSDGARPNLSRGPSSRSRRRFWRRCHAQASARKLLSWNK